ncbi:kinase-like protein [Marasmius fiardii PR-910]|nr:kinase-like protein [Marasmius fiardii PR-910]
MERIAVPATATTPQPSTNENSSNANGGGTMNNLTEVLHNLLRSQTREQLSNETMAGLILHNMETLIENGKLNPQQTQQLEKFAEQYRPNAGASSSSTPTTLAQANANPAPVPITALRSQSGIESTPLMLLPRKPANAAEFEQVLKDVQVIIDNEQRRKELLRSTGADAQEWLDLFQLLVEYLGIATKLRAQIFKILVKLSRRSGRHPQCLAIRGVEKLGQHPVGGGAFGDVWKGKVGEQLDYMQEAIIWRQLNHQNLLPFMGIYYLDSEQEQLCLVSPWMERGNLVEYLKNTSAEDVDHDLLVNVLITPNLRACLADFGLTRVSATQLLLTETSRSKGTTRWLSPELLNPGPSCYPSRESDIYAYACVCYEIYTGRVPFYEMPEATIVLAIVINKTRPSRPENCIKLHDSIWDMMMECWHEAPSSRPTILKILAQILEMKGSRRLELQSTEWKDPAFTHIWNDPQQRPPVIHAVQPTPSLPPDHRTHSSRTSAAEVPSDLDSFVPDSLGPKKSIKLPRPVPGGPQPGDIQPSHGQSARGSARKRNSTSGKDVDGNAPSLTRVKRQRLSLSGPQESQLPGMGDYPPRQQGPPRLQYRNQYRNQMHALHNRAMPAPSGSVEPFGSRKGSQAGAEMMPMMPSPPSWGVPYSIRGLSALNLDGAISQQELQLKGGADALFKRDGEQSQRITQGGGIGGLPDPSSGIMGSPLYNLGHQSQPQQQLPQQSLTDMLPADSMDSVASQLKDFDNGLFIPDGDINFERDFGQWFNPDDTLYMK